MTFVLRTRAGQSLAVRDGRITAAIEPTADEFELGEGELRPGLINAHDHLHRNHFPRLGSPPYANAYAWGLDIHARWADAIAQARAVDRRDALLFGALKNLVGGVTTVVHHDLFEPAFVDRFPIRVLRTRVAHSLRFENDLPARVSAGGAPAHAPLCLHLAEGVDDAAAEEIREAERLELLSASLVAVHVVGADPDGIARLRQAGAAVVWCPTSNAFLFGRTAPRELIDSGIPVLIGSDALLTADGTLLEELRAARCLGYLGEPDLERAVSTAAATVLGVPVPSLEPGAPADVVLLRKPLLDARPADVALVLVGGAPVLGDANFAALFARCGVAAESLMVGGRPKLVAAPLGSIARRLVAATPECGRFLS